jgi:AraC-like DNA-binding protein
VRDVILLGSDPIDAVVGSLPFVREVERAASSVFRIVAPGVASPARQMLRTALEAVPSAMSVTQFVIATGIGKSTLARQIKAAGMGTPARVIEWTRVLVAAHLLSTTGRSAKAISEQLQFPSPKAMANHFKHLLQMRPTEFANDRDPEYACNMFLGSLSPRPNEPSPHVESA